MTIKWHKLSFLTTIFNVWCILTYVNAYVTAFSLFVKVKPFSTKAFALIDFLEIRNFQIIELVCPRFCQLK